MKLNCKLRELMEMRKVTQMTVAEATGLSPATVGKLYRNQVSRFDENTVKSICKYFKLTSLSDLLEIEWEDND